MGKTICNIFNSQRVTIQNMKDVPKIKMENSEKKRKEQARSRKILKSKFIEEKNDKH